MSTRSSINVKCQDGKIRSSYIHFDGDAHLDTLKSFYNSPEEAEALVMLGDMSVLAENMGCPEGHSFENQEEGFCVFYGRDRGEDWDHVRPKEYDTFEEANNNDRGEEYYYNFNKTWTRKKAKW